MRQARGAAQFMSAAGVGVHVSLSLWRGTCVSYDRDSERGRADVVMEFDTMSMASLARRPTVLIVVHQEHSTPGRVGLALKAMGVRLDIRRPSFGEPLPATLADHAGVVVFGGPMGANDTLDWVRREIEWLETPLAEDKPLLGLCLGAQMLARTLGARVFGYDDKRSEIGYYPIEPTSAGERLCPASFPRTVYQWHSDGFDLPEGPSSSPLAGEFPQPGLSPWPARGRPAVPPGSHLSHDVPLDPSRRRAPDPARGAGAGPSISAAGSSMTAASPHGSRRSCRLGLRGGWRRPRRNRGPRARSTASPSATRPRSSAPELSGGRALNPFAIGRRYIQLGHANTLEAYWRQGPKRLYCRSRKTYAPSFSVPF